MPPDALSAGIDAALDRAEGVPESPPAEKPASSAPGESGQSEQVAQHASHDDASAAVEALKKAGVTGNRLEQAERYQREAAEGKDVSEKVKALIEKITPASKDTLAELLVEQYGDQYEDLEGFISKVGAKKAYSMIQADQKAAAEKPSEAESDDEPEPKYAQELRKDLQKIHEKIARYEKDVAPIRDRYLKEQMQQEVEAALKEIEADDKVRSFMTRHLEDLQDQRNSKAGIGDYVRNVGAMVKELMAAQPQLEKAPPAPVKKASAPAKPKNPVSPKGPEAANQPQGKTIDDLFKAGGDVDKALDAVMGEGAG